MRPAPFLPDKDSLEYLAALLTVLAIAYAGYLVWRSRREVSARADGDTSSWGR
jgi:hypothetical protein